MKKIILPILILLMIVSGVVFGLWLTHVNLPESGSNADGNIDIGDATDVNTILDVNQPTSNERLVPIGTSGFSNDEVVEFVDFVFNVRWREELNLGQTTGGDVTVDAMLNVGIVEYSLTLDPIVHELVNLDFSTTQHNIVLEGSVIPITLRVSLDRPTTRAEFDALVGESFSFEVLFTLENIQIRTYTLEQMFHFALYQLVINTWYISWCYTHDGVMTEDCDENCNLSLSAMNFGTVEEQIKIFNKLYHFGYVDWSRFPTILNSPGTPTVVWEKNSLDLGAIVMAQYAIRAIVTIAGVSREIYVDATLRALTVAVVMLPRAVYGNQNETKYYLSATRISVENELIGEVEYEVFMKFSHDQLHQIPFVTIYCRITSNRIGTWNIVNGNVVIFSIHPTMTVFRVIFH